MSQDPKGDPGDRTKYRALYGSGEETWDLSDL